MAKSKTVSRRFTGKTYRQTFKKTYAEERQKSFVSRLWWLCLCIVIGVALVYAGFISSFYGLDNHHYTYDKVLGVIFTFAGLFYMYIYSLQIYHKFKSRHQAEDD